MNCSNCDKPLPPVNRLTNDYGKVIRYEFKHHECGCGKEYISSEHAGCWLDILDVWIESAYFESELEDSRHDVKVISTTFAISLLSLCFILAFG